VYRNHKHEFKFREDGRMEHKDWPRKLRPNVMFFKDISFSTFRSDFQEDRLKKFMRKVHERNEQFVVLELGVNRELALWRFMEEKLFQWKTTKFIRVTSAKELLWRPDDIVEELDPSRYVHVKCSTKDFLNHINTMHEKEGKKDIDLQLHAEETEKRI